MGGLDVLSPKEETVNNFKGRKPHYIGNTFMDSKDIIATTKRLSTEHGCPTALQEYHGEVLGAIKDSVDLLIEKIDQYENIQSVEWRQQQ